MGEKQSAGCHYPERGLGGRRGRVLGRCRVVCVAAEAGHNAKQRSIVVEVGGPPCSRQPLTHRSPSSSCATLGCQPPYDGRSSLGQTWMRKSLDLTSSRPATSAPIHTHGEHERPGQVDKDMHGQRRHVLRRSRVTGSCLGHHHPSHFSAGPIQIQQTRIKGRSWWSSFVSSGAPLHNTLAAYCYCSLSGSSQLSGCSN
jgi:hypothetical protein